MASEKFFLRKCEFYTVKRASEPLEIDISKLRKCDPPYEGKNTHDLMEYLTEHVFDNEDWCDRNKGVYPDTEITGEYLAIENEYFDSRTKGADEWMELGVPNDKCTKNGYFETLSYSNEIDFY